MRNWIHIAISVGALLLAAALFFEWRGDRTDRDRLQLELSQAQQALQQVTANQAERDRKLSETLRGLETLRATVKTQDQVIAKLPDVLPLPKPIELFNTIAGLSSDLRGQGPGKAGATDAPRPVVLPPEDLKPLYDFAVDCQECRARLSTAAADLTDEKSKTQILSRERDEALKLARGGSLRRRVFRAAKWFLIGAAAGAIAAKAH